MIGGGVVSARDEQSRNEDARREEALKPAAIQAEGISHRYGRVQSLDQVSFQVPRGAFYALLGPNGAGKTTLLKILLGLLRPRSGTVRVDGVPVSKLKAEHRQRVGYVAEGQDLPKWMTLRRLERYLAPLYPRWDKGLADQLRERFRLPLDRKIRRMSRGEQMKVALLTSLAPRPSVLILDEPFTGMDALVKDELVNGLLELAQGSDWTVLLCSHDIGELEMLADWVGFLDRGRLILSEPLELFRDRFRRVEVSLSPGSLTEITGLPVTWMSPRRSGNRITFITCDHGAPGWESDVRVRLPGTMRLDARPASLREAFVALAAEGMGGRDWEAEGGLG